MMHHLPMYYPLSLLFFLVLVTACSNNEPKATSTNLPTEQLSKDSLVVPSTVEDIALPSGYTRTDEQDGFATYLRQLPLKPPGSPVRYFDGRVKPGTYVYAYVVDLAIGDKDLHQCADAIMRLKAEYLWKTQQYDRIHFNFTNGFRVDYTEWMKGRRMIVKGNKTYWDNGSTPSNTYADFWAYMELIFTYAGTASLEKELVNKSISAAEIGDVLIKGGFPGHAVIIIDKAINSANGEAIYLLAQSYMPAQETHVLKNPHDANGNPWYTLDDGQINTPEWTFDSSQLKSFAKD